LPNVLEEFNKLAEEGFKKPKDFNALHVAFSTKAWHLGGNCKALMPKAKKEMRLSK
jgi:hypothetical protein